jgi:hypothetical protein
MIQVGQVVENPGARKRKRVKQAALELSVDER